MVQCEKVTFVLTSKERPELLERTLDSFFSNNTYPIERFILHEDSSSLEVLHLIKEKYSFFEIINSPEGVGLRGAIDKLYSLVETPYVFHCEDDWLFLKGGFIEVSLPPLLRDPKILQVHLRRSVNGHFLSGKEEYFGDRTYYALASGFISMWHGYSHNPSLRRKSDLDLVLPHHERFHPSMLERGSTENFIGSRFRDLGYRTLTTDEDYIRHIG